MKKLRLLLGFILISVSAQAQFGLGKIEDIQEVKKRKLIVMIEEPHEKVLKKIAKNPERGTEEEYKADLKVYNDNVKEVVETFWPYNKADIQYMTIKQIEALRETKSKAFALLWFATIEPSATMRGYHSAEGLVWIKDGKADFDDRNREMLMTNISVSLIEQYPAVTYTTPLFDVFPTKASLVYGVRGMEGYFDMRVAITTKGSKMRNERDHMRDRIAKRAPLLKNKTLLIREDWVGRGFTSENLKDYYPYPYQICDKAFLDEVAMKQDEKFAYAAVLPFVVSGGTINTIVFFQYVMDAADNQQSCVVLSARNSSNIDATVIAEIVAQIDGEQKK